MSKNAPVAMDWAMSYFNLPKYQSMQDQSRARWIVRSWTVT